MKTLKQFNEEKGINTVSFKEVTSPQHTQEEWSVSKNTRSIIAMDISKSADFTEICQMNRHIKEADANADRIVEAVNMHDELVKTIMELDNKIKSGKWYIRSFEKEDGQILFDFWKKAQQLLKQAEQK